MHKTPHLVLVIYRDIIYYNPGRQQKVQSSHRYITNIKRLHTFFLFFLFLIAYKKRQKTSSQVKLFHQVSVRNKLCPMCFIYREHGALPARREEPEQTRRRPLPRKSGKFSVRTNVN